MTTFINWNYISNINILEYLKYILNQFNNDLIYFILEYLIPKRQHIKVVYEGLSFTRINFQFYHETIDYNQFVYQLAKTVLYKYKTVQTKKIIPSSKEDTLLLLKTNLEKPKHLVIKNKSLFYRLFMDLYIDFYKAERYLCMDYSPYHEINEKYYNFLNDNNVSIM